MQFSRYLKNNCYYWIFIIHTHLRQHYINIIISIYRCLSIVFTNNDINCKMNNLWIKKAIFSCILMSLKYLDYEVEHSTNPLDPWNWTIKYKTTEKTMTKVTTSIMLIFLHCNFGTRFISYFIFIFCRFENSMEYSSSSRIDVKYNDISWFIHFDTSCCDIFIPFYINNW